MNQITRAPPTLVHKIIYRPIASLAPYRDNARVHSRKQIRQLANAISTWGFISPVIADDSGNILAGHGRIEAAKLLGMTEVPTILVTDLTEEDKKAFRLADNRLAELAGWDEAMLRREFGAMFDLDLEFDIETTGFAMADIDRILRGDDPPSEPDVELPDPKGPAVSRLGDLWLLGRHRLLCGDAREPAHHERLMAGEKAEMIFADVPYNLPIAGHVSGLGKVVHGEFAMASGEMSRPEFTAFLATVMGLMAASSKAASIHFIMMDWRHLREVLDAGEEVYSELRQFCVWAKTNAGMGSFYRSQHELVLLFKHGKGAHINNFGLGKKGRHRSNLWTYPGANVFRKGRTKDLAEHPTVKPVAMVADAILDCSGRKGVILDPFVGTGTTLLAAERTGRRGCGMEIDPHYVDAAVRRLEQETGRVATLETGETFEQVKADRIEGDCND